ncbi:MAG: hypothetical protein H7125_14915, partial [Proteobacteria bacterium]|nr:hypothetical protein [Burkholderiales bacterium]
APPALSLTADDLDPRERRGWERSEAALAQVEAGSSFIQHLLAQTPVRAEGGEPRARCVMPMGIHVGNRVGHAQGGVSFALAALTACAAAPPEHRLVEASAWYLDPGEGRALKVDARVRRAGRRLSVVDTVVAGKGRTHALRMLSTHCAIGPPPGT